jgi:hypothetical protein
MDDNLTVLTNDRTISFIQSEISKKIGSRPYLSNGKNVTNVVTDMDHQPYTRWFRGVYYYPEPIAMEREAGWRVPRNICYSVVAPQVIDEGPSHCYESACGTIYPCVPSLNTRYADREVFKNTLNKECVVKYR